MFLLSLCISLLSLLLRVLAKHLHIYMSSLDGNEIHDINCMYGQTLARVPQVEGNPRFYIKKVALLHPKLSTSP